MTKPWEGTGLSDFKAWLGNTRAKAGLIYRGDGDFEQLGPGGKFTVLEFKEAGEAPVSRGQLAWLRARAKQPRTEVRVIREVAGTDPEDPEREVRVYNPATGDEWFWSLVDVRNFVDSRAYRHH